MIRGYEIEGYNGRLDALQAGILRAKLPRLPKWNQKRRAIARRYNELFRSQTDTIVLPCISPGSKSVYHLYVIRVKNRDQLRESLEQANIATQIHYPTPLHLQRAYSNLGYQAGDFPVAEKVAAEVLSLPIYPQLKARQQKRIAGEVVASLETRRASDRTAREVPCAAWEEHAA